MGPCTFARAGCGIAVALALLATPALAAAAPANDHFGDAIPIRVGQTIKGTVERASAEPPYEVRDARSVWYGFRVRRAVLIDINICGATFDSLLTVYAGRSLGSLRRLRSSEGGCREGFGVALRARPGRAYSIAVSGFSTPTWRLRDGSFRLRVRSIATPPNDDFSGALPLRLGSTVAGTTAGGSGERGEPRHCCGIPHTVWYRLRVATAGHVRLDACNESSPRVAVYTGRRVDGLASLVHGSCRVQFSVQPGVSYHVAVDDQGHWGRFRLLARTARPPANDRFADATPIALGTTTPGTTRDAGRQPGEHSFAMVWFRLSVPQVTDVAVDGCPTRVSVSAYTGDSLDALEGVGTAFGCRVEFMAQPGVSYSIQVYSDLETDFSLSARAVAPPP